MAIKVLHLIDSGGLYGAEIMLLTLVEEQVKLGLDPLILSVGTPDIKEKALEIEAKNRGLPVKPFRMGAGFNLKKAYQIISFAQRENFNIMHSHGYKFNILIGMMPTFVRKIPLVTTLHGYTGVNDFSLLKLYQYLERLVLKYVDGIVFVSGEIKNNPILKGFKSKNETIIFNGIDASKIITEASNTNSISIKDIFSTDKEKYICIGAVGRLSPEKGFELLIDVFARLALKVPELCLVIVGEGELRPLLEQKIKQLGLVGKVKLTGFIKPAYRLMSELDGIVMPSFTEGLPMTLLEACALGKRCVASDVGSIAEVLRNYAESIIVKPGDGKSLEAAIEKLIIDNAGKPIEASGWTNSKFSSDSMAKQYFEFYKTIINNQRYSG